MNMERTGTNRRALLRLVAATAVAGTIGTAAMAQEFTISIATGNNRPHPNLAMADYMKEQLEARSDGRLAVQVFTAGQLGSQQDMFEQVRMGVVEVAINVAQNVAPFVPEMQVFQLSYLFPDYTAFNAVIADGSPVHDILSASVAANLDSTLLALSGGGTRNVSTARREVLSPADMAGLQMRVGASPVTAAIWGALNTNPVVVDFGETYSAMQTGLINATESSISAYESSRFYEVAPFLSMTQHEFMVSVAVASDRALARLPEDLRNLIIEVGRETESIGTAFGIEADDEIVDRLVAQHGITVSLPDTDAFVEVLVPLHTRIAADMGVGELLAAIQATVAATR